MIAPLVQEIEHLTSGISGSEFDASVYRLDQMHQRLEKSRIFGQLSQLGYERHMPDVMALKENIRHLPMQSGRNAITSQIKAPTFQRNYRRVRNLVEDLCLAAGTSANASHSAHSYGALHSLQIGRLTFMSPIAATAGMTLLTLCSLGGLAYGSQLRAKRLKRERRQNKRYPCNIPVQLIVNGQTSQHYLVDISCSGANIENQLNLPDEASLSLSFGSIEVRGIVIWSNSKFAGVKFERLLLQQDITEVIARHCDLSYGQNAKRGTLSGTAQMSRARGAQ
ncbi:MAG: PilZ domain-containing protein [Pseudomonadota bacterium]